MKKSSVILVSAIALGLAMFVPLNASAQGVNIYIGPGYPGYGDYPAYDPGYPPYDAGYPAYDAGYPVDVYYPPYPRYYGAYSYPRYGYGYARPYYGNYWGQGRRVARRVYRRHERW
jgi:hypothetical protein